ncbi:hypothetical protein NDU88_010247 [Pleurodeles waltl]|uniref:Uncharacterized protein n=1 Tax=Pleurodeles waltl TaxID=8319 RepID=A0AAV7PXC7_PLEWA|nr:hypothetical protein NDU88_010247 [Pleurodeles waltl]
MVARRRGTRRIRKTRNIRTRRTRVQGQKYVQEDHVEDRDNLEKNQEDCKDRYPQEEEITMGTKTRITWRPRATRKSRQAKQELA